MQTEREIKKQLVFDRLTLTQLAAHTTLLRIRYNPSLCHPAYPASDWNHTVFDARFATFQRGDDYFMIKPYSGDGIYFIRPGLGDDAENQIMNFILSFREKDGQVYQDKDPSDKLSG